MKHNLILKKIVSFILCLLLTFGMCVPSFAATGEEEQIEPRIITQQMLNVLPIEQDGTLRCWAAYGATVTNYLTGGSYTEQSFCRMTYGHENDVGADMDTLVTGLRRCQVTAYSFTPSDYGNDVLSMASIMNALNAGKPIITMHRIDEQALKLSHAMVIVGYYNNDTPYSSIIYYMDPEFGAIYSTDYTSFCSLRGGWISAAICG